MRWRRLAAGAIFFGTAVLVAGTTVYSVAELGVGLSDIDQDAFGLWLKYVGEDVPYIVLTFLVFLAPR